MPGGGLNQKSRIKFVQWERKMLLSKNPII